MSLTEKEAEEFAARKTVWTNTLDTLIRSGLVSGESVSIANAAVESFDILFGASFEKDRQEPKPPRKPYTRKAKT